MNDIKKYLIAMEMSKASEAHIRQQLQNTISEGMEQGMVLDRSGKAKYKASIEELFNITKQQADIVKQAVQEIGNMDPKGIQQLKSQLKETMDFVSGILEKTKDIVNVDDLMSQGKSIGKVYGDMYQKLERVDKLTQGLNKSMKGLEKSFKPFMAALGSIDTMSIDKAAIDAVAKAEKKLKGLKQPDLLKYDPSDYFSEKSTDELINKQKELTAAVLESERALSGMKKTDKGYASKAEDLASLLADLKAVNNVLSHDQFGTKDITTKIVATLTEAGDALQNKIKNLKIDDIQLTVTLPDANADKFNAQVDDFVKQATQKFQGKPIEVSVDLISPFKDAKADTLPAEHEKKARELAEKFINAYNEAISQKDGADKKAKEAIDISGQLSALYDPSVSSVLMKFWDSWNKIYDSVKAGQTTLLEATKNWKQKMTEELKLKFVWFNEDAAEGVSDLFERINQMAEHNPIYLVPKEDYLIGEIEKVLSEHRFSLNVDLGDAKIPINVVGGSGGNGNTNSDGATPTPPTHQPHSQTPPASNNVPDVSGELAETVDEMQDFAYTAESIGEVVTRLSDNVANISAKIKMLSADIDDLDLDKVSDDEAIQKRKDQTKKDVATRKAQLEKLEQQQVEQERAYEAAQKAEQAAQAKLNAEKARRDKTSQALRTERDVLFADNRTGQHTDRILALNAQIKELEAPFENGINALETAYNEARTKLLTIERSIRATSDNIIAANNAIEELQGTKVLKDKKKELENRNKELTAEKSKQAAFQSILDKDGNPVSLITDRLITFWESTDNTIESSRNKMEKLVPKLFAMENELKELQYELDDTDEEQDKDKHSAIQERINTLQNKISEAEKAIDQKALVKYRNYQKDANRASTRQDWMRAMGLGDIRDLGADEALEVITSVLQHYPSLAASLSSAANGKVNLKGLNIVKQLIDFIPDVQSTLGVVATTASESNEELLLKETFVNLFRIADQLNALDGLVDKKTGEVAVEALSGFITAFEKMPQMATVVQKAKALQKSTDELSDALNNNDQLKQAFDIGEAKKYLTESFYDLWKALPDTVRGNFHHRTLNLDKMNSVDKADDFVRVVYDEFVRAFSAGKLNELKIDSTEWQSVMTLLKQGAAYANHEKATKGLKDSVMGADGIKRSLYELLHSADPIHVRVVGRDGTEHDYGVQDKNKAKMDVEHTYGQTPRSLNRASNKFRITDLLTEKFTIEKGIDAEILQLESELVALDQRISTLDKEADKRQVERLSTLRDTKQNKLNHLKELSATEDGRRQYEKESARRIRAIDEEIFGKVALSTKRNAPKRKARRDYEYGDHTINKVEAERDKLKKEKERLEREIAEIDKKDPRTDENGAPIASKAVRARLQEVESLLAVDNAQKMAIESVRALDQDIETNTAKWKESDNSVKAYTRSLEALADAERKKNVLKDTKDDTFNKMSRSIKQGHDANTGKSSTDYTFQVAKQYGTMDKQLVEELEAKVAERNQLIEELETIPLSQRYGKDKNGKEGYTGRALELATRIKELRVELAKKYSESEGSYLTDLLAEQLEQIDSTYDKQESNTVAQSDVKSSDYQTQVDAATVLHQENVAKINATINTQKAYYANLIGKAQQEADKITEEWQEKVRQLNAAETKMPQYMIDEQTKNINKVVNDLEQAESVPYKTRLQETFDTDERKELEAKIKAIQQKYSRMLNEQLKPILDEATRIDREVQAKDKELKTYYYNQSQTDKRVLALREERRTATPQRTQEIATEIGKIELEYTKKYQEEVAKFKENLVHGFRKQMQEEARKVEEEGRRNAAQVLETAQKEAVATYNKSESNTGKKVRAYTSIERELETQRKAAIEAEGKAHREALAQITQVDPKQIEQETKAELAKIKAEREATKKATVDRFKENGAYKTDETLVTEHITASKEAAEKTSEALNKSLEQRKNMRKTLMDEYNLSEEMVATQDKVAKSEAKRVKVKAKSAQSSAAESDTPPAPKSPTPSGGGQSGSGGGSYGGFINTSGLAQESTLRGIWELLNGGAPANGWGDENDGKSGASSSVVDLNQFATGISDTVSIIKDLPHEAMGIVKSTGELTEVISGTKNSIADKDINAALARHVNETMFMALHNHPLGDKALSEDDLRGTLEKSVNTGTRANIRFGGSLADGTITTLDALQIPEKLHNTLISNYHKALVEELNNNPDVLAMKPSNDTFDGDIGIRSDILDNPELKAKAEEAINRALVSALNKTVHNANAFKQFDISGIQDFINQVVKPAQEQVAKNVARAGTKAAVEASSDVAKTTITQEEIDKYYAEHKSRFKTVQGENGKLKYANDKFSRRVGQALLHSNVLNKDDSAFVQEDAKKLQTAYDQIQQALAVEASKALGDDVIAFLQKLQGEIVQKLQANGYGLEKVDQIKQQKTGLTKRDYNRALSNIQSVDKDNVSMASDGIQQVFGVLSSKKTTLHNDDLKALGSGYFKLVETVNSEIYQNFNDQIKQTLQTMQKDALAILDQYGVKVLGTSELQGSVLSDENGHLINRRGAGKNGGFGKTLTNMSEPAVVRSVDDGSGGTKEIVLQKAKGILQIEKEITKEQQKQSQLAGDAVQKEAEAADIEKKTSKKKTNRKKTGNNSTPAPVPAPTPTPKSEPITTPTYSAGSPQPTAGGGLPAFVNTLSQLLNVVAKDSSVQEIIKALGNGIKSAGSGGKQPDDGEKKSLNLGADEALERMIAQVNADYPGAVRTGNLRANAKGYSVDFWRDNTQTQQQIQEKINKLEADGKTDTDEYKSLVRQKTDLLKIQEEINKLEAEGKVNTDEYNELIQQRTSLLQKQEKITLSINKDTGDITSKVGIENFAVGANAAEKELQTVHGVLSQLQEARALQFNPDGKLTSQNQSINDWIKSMQALQVQRDKFASEGTLFDSKNQQVLSQMTAQTAQYRKEIMDLLRVEGKFGGNVVDTFANPQSLAGTSELNQKLIAIANTTGEVQMETVKFDTTTNTLSYTIRKNKNEVQDMTLHMDSLSGAVTQQAGQIRHVDTAWEKFGKSLKGKFQEVARYLMSFGSIYRVWGTLKQGVGYIKEIDTALTELKKVTDATDREYAQFLKTMSKTAGVVGSTTSELTKSASDWARLGFSMQQAGELAKSTAILMNVSEFDNVDTATEALISSLQAFNYTADDSIKIVDKLNIVGKIIAQTI